MAAQPRVGGQDRGEQGALATADVEDGGKPGPVEAGDELRDLLFEPQGHLPVERLTQVGMFDEVGPEILAIAAWVGRLAGGDAVGEFDEGQFGAARGGIQVQEDIGEAIARVGAEVRSELGGLVAGGCPVHDPEGREVAQQQIERDR